MKLKMFQNKEVKNAGWLIGGKMKIEMNIGIVH